MNWATKRTLARDALNKAIRFRHTHGIGLTGCFPLYDTIEKLGIELRFIEISSMEGMYCKEPGPIILINSERPTGRKMFTCAHELGHHVYNHGTRVDELTEPYIRMIEKEFVVDCFAGYLLMPPLAVKNACFVRGWSLQMLSAEQVFTLSNLFGVGYLAFLTHIHYSLGMINKTQHDSLNRIQPAKIKKDILGEAFNKHLVIIDCSWPSSSIEIQVGDRIIIMDEGKMQGQALVSINNNQKSMYEAINPGISILTRESSSTTITIRVSKKSFQGRSIYRYLEDPDYGI
jgi:Zn-dependent peptidase ImmA (M78 family)